MLKHTLHRVLLALAALLLPAAMSSADPAAPSAFYLHDGDSVVMYGDSITDQKLYTVATETFVTTRFPKLSIEWTASGWGGDTVGGGGGGDIDTRLQRDVLPYKPTVMTIMLGMNDGRYRAFNEPDFDTYKAGFAHILSTVTKSEPNIRFTLILPSAYDDVTKSPSFPGGYNGVLVQYGQFLASIAKQNGYTVADFNSPMVAALNKALTINPSVAGNIIPGRVHPSPAGHLIMAEALLKAWNAPSLVDAVTIDAAAKNVLSSDNATITNLKFGPTTSWDELDGSLPMPYSQTDPVTALVLSSTDFIQALDQQPLIVTGLAAGKYDLTIDSTDLGDFTSDQLATGINLATLPTPMFVQAQSVNQLVADRQNWHARIYHSVQAPFSNVDDPAVKTELLKFIQVLRSTEDDLVKAEKSSAVPVVHHYVLKPL